jgi:hypothetical protein
MEEKSMMRRILAGAAIAVAALGLSASAASADVTPGTTGGAAVLSGFQIVDDAANRMFAVSFDPLFANMRVMATRTVNANQFNLNVINSRAGDAAIGGTRF